MRGSKAKAIRQKVREFGLNSVTSYTSIKQSAKRRMNAAGEIEAYNPVQVVCSVDCERATIQVTKVEYNKIVRG